jgi:hypothetical protein
MKKVLLASCGIAAATLGGVALSAGPLTIGGTVAGASVAAGGGAGDRRPSDMTAARMAQAASPAGEPAPPAVEAGKPPADDPNGQAAPANRRDQPAPANRRGQPAVDDWDGPGDDADDRPGEIDDDRHGVDDPH